jgi:hypothetical protein
VPASGDVTGSLTADDRIVTFAGTVDDANHNCVPGDHVTLTFASGTTSLETFLIANHYVNACAH